MQITAPISPGSSGGPVINQNGQVIGIASASIIIGQNLNFAIPVNKLKEIISKPSKKLPFNKASLPVDKDYKMSQQAVDNNLLTVFNINRVEYHPGGSGDITFSVRNDSRRDIKNIKVLVLWKSSFSGEVLHFSPILVEDIIPSLQTKIIRKDGVEAVGALPRDFKTETRIIDYEILKFSAFIEFK